MKNHLLAEAVKRQANKITTLIKNSSKLSSNRQVNRIRSTRSQRQKMHYEYKSDLTLIDSFKVLKFRNGMNHTKQLVTVCLSKKADESKISGLQFHVENSTTHIVLFQGVIIKNISKIQPFMGKQENLKVLILVMNKNEGNQQKPKFIRQTAKLQFSSKQEANKFKEIVQQFLGIKKND